MTIMGCDLNTDDPGVPDLDIDSVREDFFTIWVKNTMDVVVIRDTNRQGDDYFHEDEGWPQTTRTTRLNVQGTQSNAYARSQHGITTTDAQLHAYALFDDDIQETDLIQFPTNTIIANVIIKKGDTFRLQGFNKSGYAGQCAFQEFDLKKIDHA